MKMKKFKDLFLGILIGCLMTISIPTFADNILTQIGVIFNGINVQVEGSPVDVNSILHEGTTYLPMRKVAELVGKDVSWDSNTKTANIIEKKVSKNINMDTDNVKLIFDEKDPLLLLNINIDGVDYLTIDNLQWKLIPSFSSQINGISFLIKKEVGISKYYIKKYISKNGYTKDELIIDDIEVIEIEIENFNNIQGSNRKIACVSKDYYEKTILPLLK